MNGTALRPEVCGELPAMEAVTAAEGEGTAGAVVSAAHTLCLKLQVKLQRFVRRHIRQGRLSLKWSCVEGVRLCSLVHIEPVCTLGLTDLKQTNKQKAKKRIFDQLHLLAKKTTESPLLERCKTSRTFSYPVPHDGQLSVAQQGRCCFVSEPVILTSAEIRRVDTSAFRLHSCSCVVQMNAPFVAITFRNLEDKGVFSCF